MMINWMVIVYIGHVHLIIILIMILVSIDVHMCINKLKYFLIAYVGSYGHYYYGNKLHVLCSSVALTDY